MPNLYWDSFRHCLRDASRDAGASEVSETLGDCKHMIRIKVSGKKRACSRFVEDLTAFPYYRVERVSDYVIKSMCVFVEAREVRYREVG